MTTAEAIAQLSVLAEDSRTSDTDKEAIGVVRAEIERLTKERDEALEALEVTRGAVTDGMNEIERLTGERDDALRAFRMKVQELFDSEAEIERLREAGEGLRRHVKQNTPEQAEAVARWREVSERGNAVPSTLRGEAGDSPTRSELDVGPPAPGEGDDLDNPEIGMVC